MNAALLSLICLLICIHAVLDLNAAHGNTSSVRKAVLFAMAGTSFAGICRPAMEHDAGDLAATAVILVMATDCMIRRYWRHLYNDRCDPNLIARLLRRNG